MTSYARRTHRTIVTLEPEETRVYRLPPLTAGRCFIQAFLAAEPGHVRRDHRDPRGGRSGRELPPPRGARAPDLTLELLNRDQVFASEPLRINIPIPGTSDEWFLRVRRAANRDPAARRYQLTAAYSSILPMLERRIAMEFFRQGFAHNWNRHPYVTELKLHGDSLAIELDEDFAEIYGLPNPFELDLSVPFVDFRDVRSTSIRFAAGADRELDPRGEERPYFACIVEVEGDGDEIDGPGPIDFNLDVVRLEIRFYPVVSGTGIAYRSRVLSPLLDAARGRGLPGMIESRLDAFQRADDGTSTFGRHVTPWLIGEHHAVHELSYEPTADQIVVRYVGRRARPDGAPVRDNPETPRPRPLPADLAAARPLFDVPDEMPQDVGLDAVVHRPPLLTSAGSMPEKFDHIVVLMMENRSFDQVLGYLSRDLGRTDVRGLAPAGSPEAERQVNTYNNRVYRPRHITDTAWLGLDVAGPSHEASHVTSQMADGMAHFVSNYADRVGDTPAYLQRIMDYYGAAELPAYAQLASQFAICDNWFTSHVGPTWPNRFIAFTGGLNRDDRGEPELNQPEFAAMTPIEAPTIFDHLTDRGVSWRVYEHNYSFLRLYTRHTFELERIVPFHDPVRGFELAASRGELPAVTWIEPDYIDLPPGNDDHPPADMADGQRLVARIVRALIRSPQWERTALVITYDEHGGFYDHLYPERAAPLLPPDGYTLLGPRVPTFVVSPYVRAGRVATEVFDHTSIAATILRRFCSPAPPRLSQRADEAVDLRGVFELARPRPAGEFAELAAQLTAMLPRGGAIVRDHRDGGPPPERDGRGKIRVPEGRDDFHALLGIARMITGSLT